MTILSFLEQLATNPHHNATINAQLTKKPADLQQAFRANSSTWVKKQFSNTEYYADFCKIAQA